MLCVFFLIVVAAMNLLQIRHHRETKIFCLQVVTSEGN